MKIISTWPSIPISAAIKERDGQSYEIRKITITLPLEVKTSLAQLHPSRSTIETGGDTTIPSPGRSPKQPLPGIGLHNPLYMVGKLAPSSTHFTRGLVKYVPGRDYFRAVPSIDGDKFATSPTRPNIERLTRGKPKLKIS